MLPAASAACQEAVSNVIRERLDMVAAHEKPSYPFSLAGFARYEVCRLSELGIYVAPACDSGSTRAVTEA
jgi:hypothetical protein